MEIALGLWEYDLHQVLWENALLFEAFRGGLSHTESMCLDLEMREAYLEIASKIIDKKNKAASGNSGYNSGVEFQ